MSVVSTSPRPEPRTPMNSSTAADQSSSRSPARTAPFRRRAYDSTFESMDLGNRDIAPTSVRTSHFLGWVSKLVHDHRSKLIAIARSEGLAADDALDCAQEAFQSFLCLPQARLLVDLPDDSVKILTVLARNLARNGRRKHHRARPHDSSEVTLEAIVADDATADDVVARAEEYATMVGCLHTLSEIQRAVVTLRLVDDVAGEDVAKSLDMTPGNVAIHLFRAKEKLRACLTY